VVQASLPDSDQSDISGRLSLSPCSCRLHRTGLPLPAPLRPARVGARSRRRSPGAG